MDAERTRLLLVDDDEMLRLASKRLLEKAGYEVFEASGGNECLRLANKLKPDLILLDVMLPDILGTEVCRQIKQNDSHAGCSVILFSSAIIESEDQAAGLEGGADGYIARPISNRELLARVEAFARVQKAERALAWEAGINAAIAELSTALISIASLDEISGMVLERAKSLTGSEFGFVGYIDTATGYLVSSTLTKDIWGNCQIEGKNYIFDEFKGLWGWVLNNKKPILVNDPIADPRSTGVPFGHIPILKFLSAPAIYHQSLVGTIALANPGRDYNQKDLSLVERLALLYALAVRQAGARQAMVELNFSLGERLKELKCLSEISSLAARADLPLGYILQEAVLLIPPAWQHPEITYARVVLFEQEYATPGFEENGCGQSCEIYVRGEKAGFLEVCYLEPDGDQLVPSPKEHLPEENGLLRVIAERIGETAERKLAEAARSQYANEQAALYAVTSAATAILDPEELLLKVLDVVLSIPSIHAEAGWVMLPGDGETNVPRLAASNGLSGSFASCEICEQIYQCEHYSAIFAGGGPPEKLLTFAACPCPPMVTESGKVLKYHAIVPLSSGLDTLGVLNLGWSAPQPYSEADRTLLVNIGRQVGLALRNAQLYQSAAQLDRMQTINEIALALTRSLDYQTVVDGALPRIKRLFNAQSVFLYQSSGKDGELVCVRSLPESSGERPPGAPPETYQALHEKTVVVTNYRVPPLDENTAPERPKTQPLRSLAAAPLVTPEQTIGVFTIERYAAFHSEDARAVQAVASILAVALDNARLYEDTKTLLRERELAHAQLVHAEKISALGRLAASVAHEINNPLQAIQGCLTLLGEEMHSSQRPEKLDRYLHTVEVELDRIAAIVRRVREFYRPAKEGFHSTDLRQVIKSVLDLTDKQLTHSQVTAELSWDEAIPPIQANPDHLKQVFLNLFLNAVDAMPKGGRLQITGTLIDHPALSGEPAEPSVCVEVMDSGEGIPPENLGKIFEPFFTTKAQGSGLGLYITYNIIQSKNGQLTVKSEMGKGTTFKILLPLALPVKNHEES